MDQTMFTAIVAEVDGLRTLIATNLGVSMVSLALVGISIAIVLRVLKKN